jgi:hypothetical protein
MDNSVPTASGEKPEPAGPQPGAGGLQPPQRTGPGWEPRSSHNAGGIRRLVAIVLLAGGLLAVGGVAAVNAASPAPSAGTPAAPGATAAPGTTAAPSHPCDRPGGGGAPSA